MNIKIEDISKIKLQDFIKNPNYEVVRTPSTLINYGFFKKNYKPYGQYDISEVAYGGWVIHGEDYINKIGLVIHEDQVCWPPKIIIYYKNGTEDSISYKSYEEAKAKHDEILSKMGDTIEV